MTNKAQGGRGRKTSETHAEKSKREWRNFFTRTFVLGCFGGVLLVNEAFIRPEPRSSLVLAALGMLGGPLVDLADRLRNGK